MRDQEDRPIGIKSWKFKFRLLVPMLKGKKSQALLCESVATALKDRDRWIPWAHWLASLIELESFRCSVRTYLKNHERAGEMAQQWRLLVVFISEFQRPHCSLQPPLSPVLEYLMTPSVLWGYCMHQKHQTHKTKESARQAATIDLWPPCAPGHTWIAPPTQGRFRGQRHLLPSLMTLAWSLELTWWKKEKSVPSSCALISTHVMARMHTCAHVQMHKQCAHTHRNK